MQLALLCYISVASKVCSLLYITVTMWRLVEITCSAPLSTKPIWTLFELALGTCIGYWLVCQNNVKHAPNRRLHICINKLRVWCMFSCSKTMCLLYILVFSVKLCMLQQSCNRYWTHQPAVLTNGMMCIMSLRTEL
jgi:hypothetical protein